MMCDDYTMTGSRESATANESSELNPTDVMNLEATTATLSSDISDIHIQCELLRFVQRKCCILAFDDIVNLCTSFYSLKEIEKARNLLSEYVIDRRLTKRTGSDREKARRSMNDIVKTCLDPLTQLPQFYAIDISRLPPVGVDHVDISAVLQEVSLLRQEVRVISELRAELEELKAFRQNLCMIPHATTAGPILRDDFPSLAASSMDMLPRNADSGTNIPSVAGSVSGNANTQSTSFASLARELNRTGVTERAVRRPPSKSVVGSSTTNNHVKSVQTVRTVDVFVSRLEPLTTRAELVDCVNTAKGDLGVLDINCTKLRSKYEHLYSSFHVAVTVSSVHFKSAIDLFSSAEVWPTGVFVKRYFKPRHGTNEGSS